MPPPPPGSLLTPSLIPHALPPLPPPPPLCLHPGPIPASLASLHNLGILRLGDNRLNGDLNAFAAMLKDPAELAAANNTNAVSRLFDFNVTNNGLVGPLPETLGWLGIFNPVITILVPGADGSAMVAPRVLDLSSNKFEGPWPAWLLKEVRGVCVCGGGGRGRERCHGEVRPVCDFGGREGRRQGRRGGGNF